MQEVYRSVVQVKGHFASATASEWCTVLEKSITQGSAFLSVFVNTKGTFGEQEQERVHEHVFLFLFHANL